MQQTLVGRLASHNVLLVSFLSFGLTIGIIDYIAMNSPGDDSIVEVFINTPSHKIFEVYPYGGTIILASVAFWGSLGFVAYLVVRAVKSA
jgi:hypothetical protein